MDTLLETRDRLIDELKETEKKIQELSIDHVELSETSDFFIVSAPVQGCLHLDKKTIDHATIKKLIQHEQKWDRATLCKGQHDDVVKIIQDGNRYQIIDYCYSIVISEANLMTILKRLDRVHEYLKKILKWQAKRQQDQATE